jgi:outer membrane protein assembly factor BamD
MMPRIALFQARRLLLACALVGATLSGCGHRDVVVPTLAADVLYQRASDALARSNYAVAVTYYEQLEARFPFSNGAHQAQLDLIYAYYKSGKAEEAIDAADQFMRENPTHPRVDYALYMKGVVYFDRNANILERWAHVDLTKRPPKDTQEAYSAFSQLIQRFPQSAYAPDARQRMVFLRNRLAAYEIHVANYYMRRGAFVAALKRAQYCVQRYPGAPEVKDALQLMASAYDKLELPDLAASARAVLQENYP